MSVIHSVLTQELQSEDADCNVCGPACVHVWLLMALNKHHPPALDDSLDAPRACHPDSYPLAAMLSDAAVVQ